jgi:hypothetical protein
MAHGVKTDLVVGMTRRAEIIFQSLEKICSGEIQHPLKINLREYNVLCLTLCALRYALCERNRVARTARG